MIEEEIVLKPDNFCHLSLLAIIVLAKTLNVERAEGEEEFPERWDEERSKESERKHLSLFKY